MSINLKRYLDYYSGLSKPGYAVLVTGEWGVGKTYQVLKHFKSTERYYVSLFGVETIEQINSEVIALCNPKLSTLSSGLGAVSNAASSLGGLYSFSGLSSGAFNAVFKQRIKPDRILIFDDLERCRLCTKDILGVINQYVEHHGFRVVVIAHDKEVTDELRYVKEKVFGQQIRVFAEFENAYDAFVNKIHEHHKKHLLASHKKMILNIFDKSGTNSLRILRHAVEDLSRFIGCLRVEDLSREDMVSELVCLFVAMNIEIRKGAITEQELNERRAPSYLSSAKNDDEKSGIETSNYSYSDIDLFNTLLSNKLLYSMYFLGDYDPAEVQCDIDNSIYGLHSSEKVPWKILSSFDSLEDDVVEIARVEMNKQFNERLVTNSGEMLHVFAFKMFLAENKLEDRVVADVEQECKRYIDDLVSIGMLPPREYHENWFDDFSRSHDGILYWVSDSYADNFRRIVDYLINKREKVLFDRIDNIWDELKALMHSDSHMFLCSLASNRLGVVKYQTIPILGFIDPQEFLKSWMNAPKNNWRNISLALSIRYSNLQANKYLKGEQEWAKAIYFGLHNLVEENSGLQALRIKRTIPPSLAKCFGPDVETDECAT